MSILRIADLIENKHTGGILACIYIYGELNRTTLYNIVSKNPRMSMKVDSLIKEGFIEENLDGRMCYLRLTDRGNIVARRLCDLEAEIYGYVRDPMGFDLMKIESDGQ